MAIRKFINSSFLAEYIEIYKKEGLKAVLKKGGWKMGLLIFIFFLMKGLVWLLLPYLIAKGFFS